MKVTTAVLAALSMAPFALGKVAHNVYPGVRRGDIALEVRDKGNDNQNNNNANANGSKDNKDNKDNKDKNNGKDSKKATEQEIAELAKLIGLTAGLNAQLNLLWVNLGGGSVTTIINSEKTVTVTATQAATVVNGAAGGADATAIASTAPASDVPSAAPATPTQPAGVAAPAGGAATHTVTVGGPQGLAFSPAQTKAAVGDTVIFTFLSQNHTVTQSAFDKPCVALPGGMDSGFQANLNNTVNPPPQVAMQVMVDTPLCKVSPYFFFLHFLSPLFPLLDLMVLLTPSQGSTAAKQTTAARAWSFPSTLLPKRPTLNSKPRPLRRTALARTVASPAVVLPLLLPQLLPRPLAVIPLQQPWLVVRPKQPETL